MKKTYIAPKSKEIKLNKLMDHGQNLSTASAEDHIVDAKRMDWDDEMYEALPDNGNLWDTNLWDDAGWE